MKRFYVKEKFEILLEKYRWQFENYTSDVIRIVIKSNCIEYDKPGFMDFLVAPKQCIVYVSELTLNLDKINMEVLNAGTIDEETIFQITDNKE